MAVALRLAACPWQWGSESQSLATWRATCGPVPLRGVNQLTCIRHPARGRALQNSVQSCGTPAAAAAPGAGLRLAGESYPLGNSSVVEEAARTPAAATAALKPTDTLPRACRVTASPRPALLALYSPYPTPTPPRLPSLPPSPRRQFASACFFLIWCANEREWEGARERERERWRYTAVCSAWGRSWARDGPEHPDGGGCGVSKKVSEGEE